MQKNFFSGHSLVNFLRSQTNEMTLDISNLSNDEIANSDINDWVEYYIDKFQLEPINLLVEEKDMDYELEETKIDVSNSIEYGGGSVDGYNLIFTVSYDGDSRLFDYRPSTYRYSKYDVENFIKSTEDKYGSFQLIQQYLKSELDNKDTSIEYIYGVFKKLLENYVTMISYVNKDITKHNDSLENECRSYLEKRKEKAESFIATCKKINIPLVLDKNAPNLTPIKMRPRNKPRKQKPTQKEAPHEYGIEDETYKNINNIISMCGRAMEKTLRTYCKLDEEELRDVLLATLSTHYDNASAEKFNKNGKTDILIEAENKAAFVGECKLWKGEKSFEKAVEQVLGYSTWRESKISLIIFNKGSKNFHDLLDKISDWVNKNTKRPIREFGNVWNCKYFRKDTDTEIDLCILVFDLFQPAENSLK